MDARAAVVAEHRAGRTVLAELRSAPPLTLRATIDGVHLVGSGAGPLGGDRLALDVEVGVGAELRLSSVAASMVHPGPTGASSHLRTDATVGAGATLLMTPLPVVLVRGCDHRTRTRIRVAEGATVAWREQVVLGRHDEPSGSLRHRLDVEHDGAALLRSEVALGGRWPEADGPAGVDGARAVGSLLVVGDARRRAQLVALADDVAADGIRLAVLELDGPAVLLSVVGDRAVTVGAVLDRLWQGAIDPGHPVGNAGAGGLRDPLAPPPARVVDPEGPVRRW